MKCTFNRPNPKAITVTGAALRSVQSADAAAIAAYDAVDRALESLCTAFGEPGDRLDATRMANIYTSLEQYSGCVKKVVTGPECSLAPRWKRSLETLHDLTFSRPSSCLEGVSASNYGFSEHANHMAEHLRRSLSSAGVPMNEAGVNTAEYWQDAAARGC